MILAKIVGTVVATRKDERLVASKLLVARPLDPSGKPDGNYLVAIDTPADAAPVAAAAKK
jgi:microcompartment protein CcmK/EutM